MRLHPRWLAHLVAWFLDFSWLPCPVCARPFAGFEWHDWFGHSSVVGDQGICPVCTRRGVGDHCDLTERED